MVHVTLFEKLFEVDLSSPDGPARWWFVDGWVDHALTNEEVLYNAGTRSASDELAEAVETLCCPVRGGSS
jgi:hypothetical protein